MFLALSAILNIFLDLFCIVVLKWGCAGAAIATITAQAISGILCLVFIAKKMNLLWLSKAHRFPERMHPCLESHGVVANELVEKHSMEYNLGGNTILWFSLVLFR